MDKLDKRKMYRLKPNRLAALCWLLAGSVAMCLVAESTVIAEPKVKIGVIASLTGEFAKFGRDAVDAITLAAEDLAAGKDSRVTFVVEDGGYDVTKSLAAYRKLVSLDGIAGLISVTSTSAAAIQPHVARTRLPTAQVFLETAPQVDSMVQIFPSVNAAYVAYGAELRKMTIGKAVLIVPTDATWLQLAGALTQGFGDGIVQEEIPLTDYDVRSVVMKVKKHNPARVVLLSSPEQGALILRELMAKLPRSVELAFDALFTAEIETYRKTNPDFSRIMEAPTLVLPTFEHREFRNRFRGRFGREAGPWTEYSYDAAMLLIKSYDIDRDTWINNMHHFSGSFLTGSAGFNEVGVREEIGFQIQRVRELLD